MKPFIIGLSGKKGTGKDHTSKLFTRFGWDGQHHVIRFAFADELKVEVADVFRVPIKFIEVHKERFRHLLQAWGVARRELFGDEYWIDIVRRKIESHDCDVAVITDVRFVNEAEFVREYGGILVRVSGPQAEFDNHISETDLDGFDFDYRITNDHTPDYDDEVALLWKSVVVPKLNACVGIE